MNFKRILRDFKKDFIKNLSFILLVTLSVCIIVGFNRSMESYLQGVYRFRETCNMEDGQFSLYEPLTNSKLHKLQNTYSMTIEEYQQVDIDLTPASSDTSITLRVMNTEKTIDLAGLVEGRLPTDTYEIVLDPKFAVTQGYTIGTTISLSHIDYQVVGYAISPDYTYTLEDISDFLNSPQTFGVGYVNTLGFNEIKDSTPLTTTYAFKDPNHTASKLKEYLNDHAKLVYFLSASDNARITTVITDVNSPKVIALVMGLLLVVIIAFMISISIKNTIAKESQTIGILYSQGFTKSELLRYYLSLPCLLVSLGILIGYPIGVMISEPLLFICDAQYTIPSVIFKDTPFIIFVGCILPLLLAMLITYFSLSGALNKTPISLLRGQHASTHVSKFEKRFTFKSFSFFNRFRLKDMIRERGSLLSLFLGVFFSMFILLSGLLFRDSVVKYIDDLPNELPYKYMYTFKNPSDLNKYSKQGEQIALSSFKLLLGDRIPNVSLYGLQPTSSFFNIPELYDLEQGEVLMAPCMTAKFNIQVGDKLTLMDNADDTYYSIKVVGYAYYDSGQYFYTSLNNYNKLLNKHELSYTTLLSHTPLDVDTDKLSNFTTQANIISSTNNILSMISMITGILIVVGMAILVIVIYLLMNMILEKSTINISMVKIFGYDPKEINKLYLNGTIFILILGFIPAVPASYWLCDTFYAIIMEEMDNYIATLEKQLESYEAQLTGLQKSSNVQTANLDSLSKNLALKKGYLQSGQDPDILPLKNTLSILNEDLEEAKRSYESNQSLYEVGAISESDLTQSKLAYEKLETQIKDTNTAIKKIQDARQVEVSSLQSELNATTLQINNNDTTKASEIAQLQAQIESTQLSLQNLKGKLSANNLKGEQIIAPRDNLIIYNINTSSGAYVNGLGQPLIQFMDLNTLYVSVEIPEESLSQVSLNTPVTLNVADKSISEPITGTISHISNFATEKDGDTIVEADVKVTQGANYLKPGLSIDAYIETISK